MLGKVNVMTSSRIVRGTKGRVFVYIIGIILITAIIACYNNTLSQLEDVRKAKEVCNQENENLSTQLQSNATLVFCNNISMYLFYVYIYCSGF